MEKLPVEMVLRTCPGMEPATVLVAAPVMEEVNKLVVGLVLVFKSLGNVVFAAYASFKKFSARVRSWFHNPTYERINCWRMKPPFTRTKLSCHPTILVLASFFFL